MTSRNDRRLHMKALRKSIINHPVAKRIARNLRQVGAAATEIYRIDGDTQDQHVYFDVYSMRTWAIKNLEPATMPMDWQRAEDLIKSGAVDRHRIIDHTVQQAARPVIVGRDAAGPGNDQILDGAHTYVAMALGATASGLGGQPVPVAAYLLEPDQWKQFVIPNHIAKALNFDSAIDGDDRSWPRQ